MSILSTSLSRIKESPTIAITQKARLLKESGKEVIALASGEPDFDTPDNIKAAAIKAIKEGQTKYTAVDGTPELKKAIVNKFKRENNLIFDVDNITVGTGGKQVIYNCILATINPGDEVIIPAPYWVSYPDIVLLAGGTPKFVECDEQSDFKISAEQLEKLITNKTKWFILNSPANPTGMCYSRSELTELVKVLKKHKHVNILTDDIYEHIIYHDVKSANDPKFVNILEIDNSLKDRTIVINGVSKAYAMTGWRIGYAAGSKELIKAMQKIQSQSTTNPSSISQAAAIKAIKEGQTKYTAVDGTPELKKAIVNKFKRENNLSFDVENITVGTGGKQVIYNCILATINPGDEVIIPAPYWVSYPDIVLLAGGTPKFVECDEQSDFKISAEQLEKLITNKTKWFILNSPANPTGMCYSRSELTELVKVLKKHKHVNILTDDIYEHIIYQDVKSANDPKFVNILEIDNALKDRTIVINGVSKAYAMTGWRIGYAAGPKELIKGIQKIQSQSTTNPSSISQAAAVEALNGDQSFINTRALEFKKRRDFVVHALNNINGLTCVNPQGAFYVFPNCKKTMNKKTSSGKIIKNDTDFATYLLEETGVAIVQGSAFGLEGYFRISYATSMQILEKAVIKIKSFCESLK